MNANSNQPATAPAAKTISELLSELLICRTSQRQAARERAAQIQDQIISEYAALVAVADAAAKLESIHSKHSGQPPVLLNAKRCADLYEALANLAAIRSQNGGKA